MNFTQLNTENKYHKQNRLDLIKDIATIIEKEIDDRQMLEWFRNYALNHSKRIALDVDYALQYISEKQENILEIGATPFLLTAALQKIGYEVQGIDIEPERFQKAIQHLKLNVIKCNIEIEKIPFSDNSFNLVIFNEIFEHLRIDLLFTLREIYRVMNNNGILLLSTPNLKSIDGMINFLFRDQAYSCASVIYNEYQKLNTIGHMGHVREYTDLEVCQFLKKIGFSIEKVIY